LEAVAVSPDGTRLAMVEAGEPTPPTYTEVRLLALHQVRVDAQLDVPELQVTPLAKGGADGVKVGPMCAMAFSPDGRLLATGDSDGSVRLWDVPAADEGLALRTVVRPPPKEKEPRWGTNAIAFRPDGKVLAVATGDADGANVLLAGVPSGKGLKGFRAGGKFVTAVGFSPNGKMLVTGTGMGLVQVWDADALLGGK
jgi:WD40 repeat protein